MVRIVKEALGNDSSLRWSHHQNYIIGERPLPWWATITPHGVLATCNSNCSQFDDGRSLF